MDKLSYDNSPFVRVVQEKIHSERDRDIVIQHYVNGLTAGELSGKYHVEPRQIYRICARCLKAIRPYL